MQCAIQYFQVSTRRYVVWKELGLFVDLNICKAMVGVSLPEPRFSSPQTLTNRISARKDTYNIITLRIRNEDLLSIKIPKLRPHFWP